MGLNNGNFRVEILPFLRVGRWNDRLWNVWDGIMKEFCLKDVIECFHSRGQHLWKCFWNKRKRLHKKRVQLPQDLFGTPTWPPFYCFATPIWPPWRHVKTLYSGITKGFSGWDNRKMKNDPIVPIYSRSICTLLLTRPHDLYWKWAGTYYSEVSRGVLFWILGGGFASRFLKLWPYFTRS